MVVNENRLICLCVETCYWGLSIVIAAVTIAIVCKSSPINIYGKSIVAVRSITYAMPAPR